MRSEWQRIRIEPEKWRCSPWGDATGGFWAVATDGGRVLWFNERALRAGHGMLMTAPEPVYAVAARVLEAEGVSCSVLGHTPARPGMRALVLGRSYIIAAGFAFEPRPD